MTVSNNGYAEPLELLAKHWPKQGNRQNAYKSLIGGLLRAKFPETEQFVRELAEASGDEEVDKRLELVEDTRRRLDDGARVTGWPSLAKQIGEGVVERLRRYLGLLVRVEDLARDKRLPEEFLQGLGLRDIESGIVIPYYDRKGKVAVEKERTRLRARDGSKWPKRRKLQAYGEERLVDAGNPLILVEGESDCWTLWFHNFDALGLPGKDSPGTTLHPHYVRDFDELYVVQESDAGGPAFVDNVRKRLGSIGWEGTLRVIRFEEANDPNSLHCEDPDTFGGRFEALIESADLVEIVEDQEEGGSCDPPKKSAATILVELAEREGVELFHNANGDPFATLPRDGHLETWPLNSSGFRRWLKRTFYKDQRKTPSAQALADCLGVLEGMACFAGAERETHLRVAGNGGRTYLDLADPEWRSVEIDADGWRILDRPPVRFRRSRGMLALPEPVRGGSLDELRGLVNVASDEDWLLLLGWLTATLRPTGPYPVLVLTGEQGTAKSTLGRLLRLLVDPGRAMLRSDPSDTRDLMIAANNGWIVSYDNLSFLPQWLSDALCRLATGGGFGTRQLYTDDEEQIFDSVRPALLTSITDVVTSSDLLDRSIFLRLEPIEEDERCTEEMLNARIERLRPRIIGALLDAVAGGLRMRPSVRLDRLPRMADFCLWAESVCRSLGSREMAFVDAYNANRGDVNSLALDASPIGPVLTRALAGVEDVEDTPTEVLKWLNGEATDEEKKQKGWPKRANTLSGQLKRLAPNLRRLGFTIDLERRLTDRNRTKVFYLKAPPDDDNDGQPEGRVDGPSASSATDDAAQENNTETADDLPDANSTTDSPDRYPDLPGHCDGRLADGGRTITRQGDRPLENYEVNEALADVTDDLDGLVPLPSGLGSEDVAVTLVRTPKGLARMTRAIGEGEVLAVDLETTGLDPRRDRIRLLSVGCGAAGGGQQIFLVDCSVIDPSSAFETLTEKTLVFHNGAFDLGFLMRLGFEPGRVVDTFLLSQLLYGTRRPKGFHSLGEVVGRELGVELEKSAQTSDWEGTLSEAQVRYAALDVAVLQPLLAGLQTKLAEARLEEVARIENECLPAMAWLAHSGTPFDRDAWDSVAAEAREEAAALAGRLDQMAPTRPGHLGLSGNWNWDSPQQVKEAFAKLGIELEKTNDDTLAGVNHPLASLIREYRSVKKLATTYGEKWYSRALHDGRLYADWRQIGADSGRMSCSKPNLQNLPGDPRYRECFRAPEGRVLVKADYSQIELRLAAKIADETRMQRAYAEGEDLHVLTAAKLLGKPPSRVSKEDRRVAKSANFGLLYGMGAEGYRAYARSNFGLDLSPEEAARYRSAFFDAYPALRRWHRSMSGGTTETRTLAGRRRSGVSRFTEKLNTPVQGSGADGLKRALALLWVRRGECPGAVPVLVVHDEIVLECDEGVADQAARWLERAMTDAMSPLLDPIPVAVDVTIGRTWGE